MFPMAEKKENLGPRGDGKKAYVPRRVKGI